LSEQPNHQWNPQQYEKNAAFVAEMAGEICKWLAPKSGERILDLGCGDGRLSLALAEAGARVLAVDGSAEMVEAAKGRGLNARVMRGQVLEFEDEFDAVFSNAALHWMRPPQDVIAGVARALKPGGRFVGEMGGHGNAASVIVALVAVLERRGVSRPNPIPWFFPTPEEYTELLENAGFRTSKALLVPRPTPLPTGMRGWMDTFAQPFLGLLPESEQETARDEAIDLLRPALQNRQGNWMTDYVRLRFKAVLSADGG
jgi:trans-aconitate methyltransferase